MRTLYLEDYAPGWSASGGSYEVTEEEILEMGQRFDPRSFHTDPRAARRSHFGGLVASGCHLFCIRSRLVHDQESGPALVAGLGLEAMDLPHPVRPGDRLSLRQECLEARRSRSRPDRGIVRLRSVVENQRGEPDVAVFDYSGNPLVAAPKYSFSGVANYELGLGRYGSTLILMHGRYEKKRPGAAPDAD